MHETLAGNIVLSISNANSSDHDLYKTWPDENRKQTRMLLADLHRHKIDLADEILVINVDGYIGEATQDEIQYAESRGKQIRYWEKMAEH